MARIRTPGDGPKCVICGKPAVWSGYCKMEDGKGYCDSAPRHDTTPAEIVADVTEERGRLYWEQVGKIADSAMDEWNRVNPDKVPISIWMTTAGNDRDVLSKFIEQACRAFAAGTYENPFEAFIVLRHSKYPNALLNTKMGPSTKSIIKDKFPKDGPFPWRVLALNAFYVDCCEAVNERFKVLS